MYIVKLVSIFGIFDLQPNLGDDVIVAFVRNFLGSVTLEEDSSLRDNSISFMHALCSRAED
jgi:hypothetical protein